MNKISKETNIAASLMELIVLIEVCLSKLPIWSLSFIPIGYVFLWLYIKIFIWDKRKGFDIIIASPAFRKNDLISFSKNQVALVIKVNAENNNQVRLNVFPIKETKNKLVNIINLNFIKFSCWLRSVIA